MKHLLLLEEDASTVPDGIVDLVFWAPPFSKSHGGDGASLRDRAISEKQFAARMEEISRWSKEEAFLFVLFDGTALLRFAPLIKEHFDVKSLLAWDKQVTNKKRSAFARQHDLIIFATCGKRKMASKGHADIIYRQQISGKPTALPLYCIEASMGGEQGVVLDPYALGGSVALAAEENGQHSISFVSSDADRKHIASKLHAFGGEVFTAYESWSA